MQLDSTLSGGIIEMDLFDLEREIAEVERIRVAFMRRRSPYPILSYRKLYVDPMPRDGCEEDLAVRITTAVGHGVPFYILTDDSSRKYNSLPAAELKLN